MPQQAGSFYCNYFLRMVLWWAVGTLKGVEIGLIGDSYIFIRGQLFGAVKVLSHKGLGGVLVLFCIKDLKVECRNRAKFALRWVRQVRFFCALVVWVRQVVSVLSVFCDFWFVLFPKAPEIFRESAVFLSTKVINTRNRAIGPTNSSFHRLNRLHRIYIIFST